MDYRHHNYRTIFGPVVVMSTVENTKRLIVVMLRLEGEMTTSEIKERLSPEALQELARHPSKYTLELLLSELWYYSKIRRSWRVFPEEEDTWYVQSS